MDEGVVIRKNRFSAKVSPGLYFPQRRHHDISLSKSDPASFATSNASRGIKSSVVSLHYSPFFHEYFLAVYDNSSIGYVLKAINALSEYL